MTPDRWKRIEDLLHSALEHKPAERAAFLDESCAGDESLRKELESLLESNEQISSFLKSPAVEDAAELLAETRTDSILGQRIGSYQTISQLGAGGMGEVYLAEDTRLGRKVAVKLLPTFLISDRDRLRRFQQEARAASGLNHPNIITIYEIGEANGLHFIATEYIRGETLRSVAVRNRLKLVDALSVVIQAADALAAAHEAGIVHRDIKPENIMLRPDGYVKVLDFGLAKLVENGPSTDGSYESFRSRINTNPGTVMGTANYMSPEQARGRDLDARSDIFSLGVVLYEIVTGRAPFEGETVSDIIAAILEKSPAPLAGYEPETPDKLQWIVAKALCKDREERYQTVNEMLGDLRDLKSDLDHKLRVKGVAGQGLESEASIREGGARAAVISSGTADQTDEIGARTTSSAEIIINEIKRHKTGALLGLASSVIVVAAAIVGLYKIGSTTRLSAPFQTMNISRVTTGGKSSIVTISPDGRYITYAIQEDGGRQSLWVKQLATGAEAQIISPAEVRYGGATFSRDGNLIYYVVQGKSYPLGALYQAPVIGGATKKLLTNISGPVAQSPDGKLLAFVYRERAKSDLIIANSDGSDAHSLAIRNGADRFAGGGPSWSPDGKLIACGGASNEGAGIGTSPTYNSVFEVRVDTGAVRQITTKKWEQVRRVCWLPDESGLIVLAEDMGQEYSQVWEVYYPSGEARRITNDLSSHGQTSLGLTADSKSLVTGQSIDVTNIWTVPVNGEGGDAKQLTFGDSRNDGRYGICWTRNGKILYSSLASGNHDIWIMSSDGTAQKQLTADTYIDSFPSPSPDGRYVVFKSTRDHGIPRLWRMDAEGSDLKKLTPDASHSGRCSPDGVWVVYSSGITGKETLWKTRIDGGDPVQITDYPSQWPEVSPDGKMIVCDYFDEQASPQRWRIGIIAASGGRPLSGFDIPERAEHRIHWAVDGLALLYINTESGVSNIWSHPIDGSPARKLTDFTTDLIFALDVSRDGKQFVCVRGTSTSDAILISNFR